MKVINLNCQNKLKNFIKIYYFINLNFINWLKFWPIAKIFCQISEISEIGKIKEKSF
jgi:hypothetical protein